MKKTLYFHLILLFFSIGVYSADAKLKVASLHPLITDVARQVAGDHATVVQLIPPHMDPHHFSPSPKTLLKAKGAKIYLASGKHLETYLPKLKSTLGNSAKIVEVGRTIPSQKISGRNSQFVCCPQHALHIRNKHIKYIHQI